MIETPPPRSSKDALSSRQLQARRQRLLQQLHDCTNFIHASVVEQQRKKSKGSRGPARSFLTLSRRCQGRTRNTYLRQAELAAAQAAIDEHQRLVALILAISEINIQLLKAHGAIPQQQDKGGQA